MSHTKEPWKQDERYIVGDIIDGRPGGEVIVICGPTITDPGCKKYPAAVRMANAARITACVNALAGVKDPASVKALIAAIRRAASGEVFEDGVEADAHGMTKAQVYMAGRDEILDQVRPHLAAMFPEEVTTHD